MSPRVGAFYCVYDDDEWLSYSVRSIYDAVDAIYFFVNQRPWNGPLTDNSSTLRSICSLPDPQNKLQLVKDYWPDEVSQRNAALARLTYEGFHYAFIIDADEIYDTAALKQMISYAVSRPQVCCWHCWFIHYWKSPGFRIDPPDRHHPAILLKLGSGGFVEYRNPVTPSHALIPPEIGFCHHLSYARTDEQIKRKLGSFSHSSQVRADWFEAVWKAWDNDHSITDLCPYISGAFQRAVPVAPELLPPVLREVAFR